MPEPVAAPVVPAAPPPVVPDPAAAAPAAPATPPVEPVAGGEPAPAAPDTVAAPGGPRVPVGRVHQLTREKWEERRGRETAEARNRELEDEVKKLKGATPVAPAAPVAPASGTPAVAAPAAAPASPAAPAQGMEQLIDAAADRKMAQREFNNKCNTVFEAGKKEIPEFEENMKGFTVFGGLSQFPGFVEAAVNLDNGHKVLSHLGSNLDEAERILSLPPIQQAIELTKVSAKLKGTAASPPISQVPNPIKPTTPVTPSSVPQPDEDGDFKSQEEFRQYRKTLKK